MTRRASLPPERGPRTLRLRDGQTVDVALLAADVCLRYGARYPDELERYDERWRPWCEHDLRYLVAWAIADADTGDVSLLEQARWLSGLLRSRGYPHERLPDALLIAADVVANDLHASVAREVVARLQEVAAALGGPPGRG